MAVNLLFKQLNGCPGKNSSQPDYDSSEIKLLKLRPAQNRRFRDESAGAVAAERAGLARFREEQELALAGVKQTLVRQIAEAESQNSDLIDEMNQMNVELKRRGEVIESLRSEEALKKEKSSEEESHSFEAEAAELRAKVEQLQREMDDAKKKEGGIHKLCYHFGTL